MSQRKGRLAGRPLRKRAPRSTLRHPHRTTATPHGVPVPISAWEQLPVVLNVGDVATLLRLSPNSVYELLKKGELLPLAVRVRGSWRFSRDRVRAFLEGE